MARLSPECNRLLQIASVIGRDFALETLQAVANLANVGAIRESPLPGEDPILAAIEEAERVGVLEDQSQGGAIRYRFAHAFFRQTLYEETFTPRRLRYHQQVARVLETQYAGRLEEHAAELVEHFAQSSDPADLLKAVTYGEMAARRAMAVYAYGEAVRLLEEALDAQAEADPDDKAKRCDLLLALGEALMSAGEPLRASQEIAEQSLALAEALGERGRASHACQLALDRMWRFGTMTMAAIPAWNRWAELAGSYAEEGTADRVYADVALSKARQARRRYAEARDLRVRALQLARQLGDPRTESHAALEMIVRTNTLQALDERSRLVEEYSQRSPKTVSVRVMSQLLDACGREFLRRGDRHRAEAIWRRLAELGTHTSEPTALLWPITTEGTLARLDGRLDDAVEAGERLVARADQLGSPVFGRQHYSETSIRALLYLGRAEEALAALPLARQLAGVDRDSGTAAVTQHAVTFAHTGGYAQAFALATDFVKSISPNFDDIGAAYLAMLLSTAVLVQSHDLAALLSQALVPAAGMGPQGGAASCIARQLGAAAALLGDREPARRYYEQALEVCAKIGDRPELTLTRLGMAELLLDKAADVGTSRNLSLQEDRTAEDLRQEAQEHLEFCIPEFEAMKMQPALERATRLQDRLHPVG